MKKTVITISMLQAFTFSAMALECFSTSSCLSRVSACELDIDPPSYSYAERVLQQYSYFTYEIKQNLDCISKRGSIAKTSDVWKDSVSVPYTYEIKSHRIPTSLEEVSNELLEQVRSDSLKQCLKTRTKLTNTYNKCN